MSLCHLYSLCFMSSTLLLIIFSRKLQNLNFFKKPKTKNFSQFPRALLKVWYEVVNRNTLNIVTPLLLNTDEMWPFSPKRGQSYTLWEEPLCHVISNLYLHTVMYELIDLIVSNTFGLGRPHFNCHTS